MARRNRPRGDDSGGIWLLVLVAIIASATLPEGCVPGLSEAFAPPTTQPGPGDELPLPEFPSIPGLPGLPSITIPDSGPPTPKPGDPGGDPEGDLPPSEAATILAGLTVAPEVNDGSYDRDLYDHWNPVPPNGCDARTQVLIDESLTPANWDPTGDCAVLPGGGDWISLYDGERTDQPSEFDIDHLVPLAEAHRSGAHRWDAATRERFANDTTRSYSLIAVSARSNRSKSDKDPAEWLPPDAGYRCTYVTDWVRVKRDWGLSVDPDEKTAIEQVLAGCG